MKLDVPSAPSEIHAEPAYDPHTAGGAMVRRQLVALPAEWTVEQAVEEIRAHSADIERLYAVYVVDDDQRLIGYLKLRDLLLHPARERVCDIMRPDVNAVTTSSDREDVLRIADRERLPVVPVTDATGHLLGLIGERELREIGREEISDDLKALTNVAPDSEPSDRPVPILRRRFPWLASALIGRLVPASSSPRSRRSWSKPLCSPA